MGRRTNLALAALMLTTVFTGLASQAIGVDWPVDTAVVHGALGLAVLLLSPGSPRSFDGVSTRDRRDGRSRCSCSARC